MATSVAIPVALIERTLSWAPGSYRVRPIKHGLTNTVFALRRGSERVALRIANADSAQLGLDRPQEIRIHRAAHAVGLAPEVLFASAELLITDWIAARPWRPEQLTVPARIQRLAPRLLALWQLPVAASARVIAQLLPQHPALHRLDSGPQVLSHGDLSAANILGLVAPQFIDFEFAGRASPVYELAQLVVSNKLPDRCADQWLDALALNRYRAEFTALLKPLRALNTAWLRRVAARRR